MKVFYVGNGKMINQINANNQFTCVGIYDLNLYILMEKPDIIIDFSHPDFLEISIQKALEFKVPLLVGTTGYNKQQMAYLRENSKVIPVIYSPNFCKGINLIKDFVVRHKNSLNKYQKNIQETHHQHKVDAPSGTALYLSESLCDCNISSLRYGEIKGIHEVTFSNENEIITIRHEALSRQIFAEGVYDAACFLLKQKPGFYTYEDWLNYD